MRIREECFTNIGEKGKYIVVIYRELSKEDGFVITAFLTRRRKQLGRRRRIWQR